MKIALKTLSWRLCATAITAIVTWFVTGSVDIAAKVMSVEFIVKMFAYYGHEHIWRRIGNV